MAPRAASSAGNPGGEVLVVLAQAGVDIDGLRLADGLQGVAEKVLSLQPLAQAARAVPRLFCVMAQSSGTRSRVRSSSAAR